MITKLSHVTIFVLDQQVAKEFYVDKLGLEVRTDRTMEGDFRWLTVGPKAQPELEVILAAIAPPVVKEEHVEPIRKLVSEGGLGAGVWEVDDCWETYRELTAKGVSFLGEPEEQFYGIEAVIVDPFGNWFSLTQPKPH